MVILRDNFGRSLSKEPKKNKNLNNTTLTSVLGEERTYQLSDNVSSQHQKNESKGIINTHQSNNLLNELVYEIISDGEQDQRPKDYARQLTHVAKQIHNLEKVDETIKEIYEDINKDNNFSKSFNENM